MGGTINGYCANCECQIDYDPLLGGKQYCGECEVLENENCNEEANMEAYYNNKYLK